MTKIFATAATLLLLTGTALAQDEDGMGGEGMGDGTTEEASGDTGGMGATSTGSSDAATTSASGGGMDAYSMAISTTWPTGGDNAADLLYKLGGANWLDLRLAIDFTKAEDDDPTTPADEGSGVFGLGLGVGYRMYKADKGRIHPYLEPGLALNISDFGNAGDTIALAAFGILGVDFQVMDQFTLGTGIGGTLAFTDKFKTIDFGLLTASINATFWW